MEVSGLTGVVASVLGEDPPDLRGIELSSPRWTTR
jgi:hypothetical protein